MRFHCWSVSNGFGIPSFSHNRCKGASEKYLQQIELKNRFYTIEGGQTFKATTDDLNFGMRTELPLHHLAGFLAGINQEQAHGHARFPLVATTTAIPFSRSCWTNSTGASLSVTMV